MNAPRSGMQVLAFALDLTATPERVWEMLTVAPSLERWFCAVARSVPERGGLLCMNWAGPAASSEAFVGHWVSFEPPKSCSYEGGHNGYPDGYAGRVDFGVEPSALGSHLDVRHEIPDQESYAAVRDRYRDAWPRALDRLRLALSERS